MRGWPYAGRLLMAQMLINYLMEAEAFLEDPLTQPVATEAAGRNGGSGGSWLPARPLEPQSMVVYKAKCLDAGPTTGSVPPEGAVASKWLPVVKAEGWTFVEMDGDAHKLRHKPGLVAKVPGSVLWINLPLDHALPSTAGSVAVVANPQLALSVHLNHLKSYR